MKKYFSSCSLNIITHQKNWQNVSKSHHLQIKSILANLIAMQQGDIYIYIFFFSAPSIPYHHRTFLKIFHPHISKSFYHYFNLRKERQKKYPNEDDIYLPSIIINCNCPLPLSNSSSNFNSFWEFSNYEKAKTIRKGYFKQLPIYILMPYFSMIFLTRKYINLNPSTKGTRKILLQIVKREDKNIIQGSNSFVPFPFSYCVTKS